MQPDNNQPGIKPPIYQTGNRGNAAKASKSGWFSHLSSKQRVMAAITVLAIVALGGFGAWTLFLRGDSSLSNDLARTDVCDLSSKTVVRIARSDMDGEKYSTDLTECEDPVFLSKLTGLEITETQYNMPVTAVMVENSPAARPQSGLEQAGIVFEAIAEGGITRFSALFQETDPQNIGPIRSLRPYYIDLFKPFDAAIAHAGGSPQALQQVAAQNIKSMSHGSNGAYYSRVTHRYAPHNLYSSRARLLDLQRSKGWGTSEFTGWARAEKASPASEPEATTINLNISGFNYNVRYEYDKTSNSYKRFQANQPHTDADSKKQLAPKIVIALVVARSQNGIYSVYNLSGSGKMTVFQDGKAIEGTWSKAGRSDQFKFTTTDGKTLQLSPGQTWVTLVADSSRITYN